MWHNINFIAFHLKPYKLWENIDQYINEIDVPMTYIETMGYLKQFENETFNRIDITKVTSVEKLIELQTVAIQNRWEGLMFAKADSYYELKRSWNNLKWKGVYETEGAIYDYEKGKTGRVIGKVGALKATLIWDDKIKSIFGSKPSMVGKEVAFSIGGLTDKEREWEHCKEKYPIG